MNTDYEATELYSYEQDGIKFDEFLYEIVVGGKLEAVGFRLEVVL